MTTLAIDIGGTKRAAALIGADGQSRDRRELPTPASQTPEALRDALSALVSPLQAHAQRVAIASTGIIRDGSLLALNPHNLGGLLHFPLEPLLQLLPIAGFADFIFNSHVNLVFRLVRLFQSVLFHLLFPLGEIKPMFGFQLLAYLFVTVHIGPV